MRLAVVAALVACGSHPAPRSTPTVAPHEVTGGDPLLVYLPDGAQVVIELDLARLRANPVVGAVIAKALAQQVAVPGVPSAPLAQAEQVVLAAYGVGTAQAATLTLLASSSPIPDLAIVAPGVYAIGPPDWIASTPQPRRSPRRRSSTRCAITRCPRARRARRYGSPRGCRSTRASRSPARPASRPRPRSYRSGRTWRMISRSWSTPTAPTATTRMPASA
jgi:hypothetical protein